MRCEGYMLVSKDIALAKKFYTDVVGATVALDLPTHVVFVEGFSLVLERNWLDFAELELENIVYSHHAGQLGFEVDDISAFVSKLEKLPSVQIMHQIKEHPWGRWAIRLYDPDGHVVEVGESMQVVVKRFLANGLSVKDVSLKTEFPEEYVLLCKEEVDISNN